MSTDFETALAVVLEHEGGFSDDPNDPGGATNFGISLRFLKAQGDRAGDIDGDIDGDGDVDADDIRVLTPSSAARFYKRRFWDRFQYGDLIEGPVRVKVFDLAVNLGPGGAHRCLQRALRAVGIDVVEDGVIGSKTRAAVNGAIGRGLLPALRSEAAGYYRVLAARKTSRGVYLNGWLNRAYS